MPGAGRLGDKAKAKIDAHGCPACPHPDVQGPGIVGSTNVRINGMPAMTTSSVGIHSACCGPNAWMMTGGSGSVFVNGKPLVRKGDPTLHCGVSPGEIIEGSVNVVDGSPMQKLLQEVAKTLATGGLEGMAAVIEHSPAAAASGALQAAKLLRWGGWLAGGVIEVAPAAVKGDTKGVVRGVVSTGAGVVVGGAATTACEGASVGIATPICVTGGIAIGGGVSWVTGQAFDAVVDGAPKLGKRIVETLVRPPRIPNAVKDLFD